MTDASSTFSAQVAAALRDAPGPAPAAKGGGGAGAAAGGAADDHNNNNNNGNNNSNINNPHPPGHLYGQLVAFAARAASRAQAGGDPYSAELLLRALQAAAAAGALDEGRHAALLREVDALHGWQAMPRGVRDALSDLGRMRAVAKRLREAEEFEREVAAAVRAFDAARDEARRAFEASLAAVVLRRQGRG